MMNSHLHRALAFAACALAASPLAMSTSSAKAAPPTAAAQAATFASVAAIFERACVHCHGGDRPVKGLALDSHAGVVKGSARGTIIVPGKPAESALVGRLRGTIQPQMPYDGDALPSTEIALVEEWIRAGAPGPEPKAVPSSPAPPVPTVDPTAPLRWNSVAPILRANCVRCHQTKGLKGPAPEGIRFDSYEATVGGGERASVLPGFPDSSPLVRAIRGASRKRMPLDGPPWLKPEAIALVERWVREGARGDDGKPAPIPAGREVRLFGAYDGTGRVDGIALAIDASTRVDGRPAAGATVEVRATVLADGSLKATRIRPRSATDGSGDDGSEDDSHHSGDDHGRHGRGGR